MIMLLKSVVFFVLLSLSPGQPTTDGFTVSSGGTFSLEMNQIRAQLLNLSQQIRLLNGQTETIKKQLEELQRDNQNLWHVLNVHNGQFLNESQSLLDRVNELERKYEEIIRRVMPTSGRWDGSSTQQMITQPTITTSSKTTNSGINITTKYPSANDTFNRISARRTAAIRIYDNYGYFNYIHGLIWTRDKIYLNLGFDTTIIRVFDSSTYLQLPDMEIPFNYENGTRDLARCEMNGKYLLFIYDNNPVKVRNSYAPTIWYKDLSNDTSPWNKWITLEGHFPLNGKFYPHLKTGSNCTIYLVLGFTVYVVDPPGHGETEAKVAYTVPLAIDTAMAVPSYNGNLVLFPTSELQDIPGIEIDRQGRTVRMFEQGENYPYRFSNVDVGIDSNGYYYIPDGYNNYRIVMLDRDFSRTRDLVDIIHTNTPSYRLYMRSIDIFQNIMMLGAYHRYSGVVIYVYKLSG